MLDAESLDTPPSPTPGPGQRKRGHNTVPPLVAAAVVAALALPHHLVATQTEATLDAGGSVVEYEGFLTSGAVSLSPTVRLDIPNASLGLQGSWVTFESGNHIMQATAAGAWLTPGRGPWRAEFAGSFGLSQYADAPVFGHFIGRSRLHLYGQRAGAWLSAATGWTFGDQAQIPLEIGAGVWTVTGGLALAGTVTGTWLAGDEYLDLVGTGRWQHDRVQLDGELGIRPWADAGNAIGDPRAGLFGELSATVSLTERVAMTLSAGSYPSDPPRGTLGAQYISLGIRLNLTSPPPPGVPTIARAILRAANELAASDFASRARLELETVGTAQVLRVSVQRASSVHIMGDFTDWETVSLAEIGPGLWEVALEIAAGVHRLNIRVNDGEWLVPLGTRLERTDFGGAVGIIVVP